MSQNAPINVMHTPMPAPPMFTAPPAPPLYSNTATFERQLEQLVNALQLTNTTINILAQRVDQLQPQAPSPISTHTSSDTDDPISAFRLPRLPDNSRYEAVMCEVTPVDSSHMMYQQVVSNLLLQHLTLDAYLSWFQKFFRLQQQHPYTVLQMGNYLHRTVINQLLSENHLYDGSRYSVHSEGTMLKIPNKILHTMFYSKFAARNKDHCLQLLNSNVVFPKLPHDYALKIETYHIMHDAILEYITGFLIIFKLLTAAMKSDPPLFKTQDGVKGLKAAFCDPIPFSHGNNLYNQFSNSQKTSFLFETFETVFVPALRKLLDSILHQTYKTNDLSYALKLIPNTQRQPHTSSVSHIDTYMPDEENCVDTCLIPLCLESTDSTPQQELSAFNSSSPSQKLPCYSTVRTGTCSSGATCKYSHDKTVLQDGWNAHFRELMASPHNPKSTPTSATPSNKYPPPTHPTIMRRQHNMTSDITSSDPIVNSPLEYDTTDYSTYLNEE